MSSGEAGSSEDLEKQVEELRRETEQWRKDLDDAVERLGREG